MIAATSNRCKTQTLVEDGFKRPGLALPISIFRPTGKFLYSSDRGEANEIEVFSINRDDGKLAFIQRTSSLGKTPRNFVIDPEGKLFIGGQSKQR